MWPSILNCHCPHRGVSTVFRVVLVLVSVTVALAVAHADPLPYPDPVPDPQQGSYDDIQRVLDEGLRRRGGEQQRRYEERQRLQEENRRQQEEFRRTQAERERIRAEDDARAARNKWAINAWNVVIYVTFSIVGVIIGGLCCFFCAREFSKFSDVEVREIGAAAGASAYQMEEGADTSVTANGHQFMEGGFIFPPGLTEATTTFTPAGGQPCTFTPISTYTKIIQTDRLSTPLLGKGAYDDNGGGVEAATGPPAELGLLAPDPPYNPGATPEPETTPTPEKKRRIPGPQ